MSECTCQLAGWCDRHNMKKHATWHKLCQSHEDYREAWDAGRGPGQERKPLTPEQAAKKARIKEAVERQQRLIGWLSLLRHPGERGAGDTAQRMVAKRERPSDATAALERLLKQCSCSRVDAVARLNRDWPW